MALVHEKLLAGRDVVVWLESAVLLLPEVHTELTYAVELYKAGVTALWPAPVRKFLVSIRKSFELAHRFTTDHLCSTPRLGWDLMRPD